MTNEKTKKEIYDKVAIEERDYWIKKLSRPFAPSNLLLDYERPATYVAERDSLSLVLPQGIHQTLNAVTNRSHFLVYAILLAALEICVYKHTGNRTILLGSPARRKEGSIAREPNAVVIMQEFDEELTVREWLLSVREILLQTYARQSYTFERLVRDLRLEHIENRCPLFDIAIELRNIHTPLPELRNDITLTFTIDEKHIEGRIAYNKALFAQESITRFGRHFAHILSQALEHFDWPMARLKMLDAAEEQQVLAHWNATQKTYEQEWPVHQLFERQVEKTPTATALIYEEQSLSYQELNAQANQVAHFLRKLGVGPETLVGLCLGRTAETVIALLGVLKAGGAYVPIDPTYPKDRLAFMLTDAQVKVLLTQEQWVDALPNHQAKTVCLDAEASEIVRQNDKNPESVVSPDHLAYLIYTSGSTGTPKGVMITHRSLHNLAEAQIEAFDIRSDSRVLQFASFSFDASVSEIFTTLLTGAALHLGSRELLMPGAGFVELLRAMAITHATFPPSALAALASQEELPLTTLVVAGEACSLDVARRWSRGRRFINAYGPTEATVCATLGHYPDCAQKPPIGRPIWNTQVYILDRHLAPVPIGVPGELYLGGVSLARGYLNRPDLTAEKFIPDPFGEAGGERLYRTGDWGRYQSGGEIEYLGRIDHQVKIRGYRVELGEIETVLSEHPAIGQVAVSAREDLLNKKRIVAYFVTRSQMTASVDELRHFVRSKLPEHMVPSVFFGLPSLPLMPNGKIDYKALPAPQTSRPELTTTYLAPRTPMEKTLTEIWAEVLGLERIGVEDHFFDLGGHSLLATQVVSRVRETFQMEIPLKWFFIDEPTVAGLAKAIEQFQIEQASEDEIAAALAELESLSEGEIQELLSNEEAVALT